MLKIYGLTFLTLLNLCLKAQVGPSFTISAQSTLACTGIPLTYNSITTATNPVYNWKVTPAQYAVISDPTASTVQITFSKDLTYTVTLTVTDNGASTTNKKIVPIYRTAKASFNASLNSVGYPNALILTNYSTGSIMAYWSYSDQAAKDSSFSTIKYYDKSGSYTVTLLAVGQKGCSDQSSYSFRISDSSSVTLPNIFTPNRDEVNDVFKPITTGINELHAAVYNREGIMLHSWHQVNGYWDGRTNAGEVCQDGVYFVILQAKGFDGKSYDLKGTVTLIR